MRAPLAILAFGSILGGLASACSSSNLTVASPTDDAATADGPVDAGPAPDIAGPWNGSVTNAAESCPNAPAAGQVSAFQTNVDVVDGQVSMTIEGVSGAAFSALVGGNTFSGTLTGSHLVVSLLGTNKISDGNCRFTWTVGVDAQASASAITGTVTYTPNLGAGSDCARYAGCSDAQRLALTPGVTD